MFCSASLLKDSLLIWQAHHRNYPAESTPFAGSAGKNRQDGWAELCCYSVFIIVGDYKFSVCFTSRQTSACYFELLYPRRIRFAPLFLIINVLFWIKIFNVLFYNIEQLRCFLIKNYLSLYSLSSSRSLCFFFRAARLSYIFLPRARPSSIFTLPLLIK